MAPIVTDMKVHDMQTLADAALQSALNQPNVAGAVGQAAIATALYNRITVTVLRASYAENGVDLDQTL